MLVIINSLSNEMIFMRFTKPFLTTLELLEYSVVPAIHGEWGSIVKLPEAADSLVGFIGVGCQEQRFDLL